MEFDGANVIDLANRFDTPFFFTSENQLRQNYKEFVEAFSKIRKFKVYYSVKTNFESEVLKCLKNMGSGAEIAGMLGIHLTEKAGFGKNDIILDGPYKPLNLLQKAIEKDIHIINTESLKEVKMINEVAKKAGKRVPIGLRIDPLVDKNYYDMLIDTYKRKFGYPISEATRVINEIVKYPNLELKGLHSHIGSQMLNPGMYVNCLEKLFSIADGVKSVANIEDINIGGGFPAQSMVNLRVASRIKISKFLNKIGMAERRCPPIQEFGSIISERANDLFDKYGIEPLIGTEPGRCMVSNTTVLVGKVVLIKGGWVFTDISVNELPENMFFAERKANIAEHAGADPSTFKELNISGPTLSTDDVIYLRKKFPVPSEGNTLVIFDTGAYCIPRSNQFTKPRPGCYFKKSSGEIKTIRKPEIPDDVTRNQVW